MKKNDIFENTDDMTLEKMSQEFPVLTDEEKERIFAMSERKYNINKFNENDESKFEDFGTDINYEVKGVEQYKRPIWYRTLSVAAAAVLMFGGVAGSMMLLKHGSRNLPATEVEETTAEEATFPTEPPTEDVSEYMTAALDLTDKLAYYEKILYNHDVAVDENDKLSFIIRNSEGQEHEENYLRVTDPEIQSGEDLKNAILTLCTDDFKNTLYTSSYTEDTNNLIINGASYLYSNGYFINDFSGYENGATIDAYYHTYGFITYNDGLYVCSDFIDRDMDYYSSEPVIISHSDDCFEASRMAVGYGLNNFNDAQVGTKAVFTFKKINGEWKIDDITFGRCVETWVLTAVNNYFNFIDTDYDINDLDINSDITEDGIVTTNYYDKLCNNFRILKNDEDDSCRVYCIIKNKEGNDYLEFTADVEFFGDYGWGFDEGEDNSEHFSYSNVTIKEIR